jgi:tetratricopeptide (TPR) repeat protein
MQQPAVPAFRIRVLLLATAMGLQAQTAPTPAAAPPSLAERGVELTRGGHCQEALPLLRKAAGHVEDRDLERHAGVAGVRCAMTLNQPVDVARFLDWMNHDFPHDAALLYLAVHAYSDLSIRASQELMYTAPSSPQVHELNAEALETQGKWKEALEEYRIVLQRAPETTGMHYRIGRLILSEPESPTTFEEAKQEMEAELKLDPGNAGAEYVLGEIARRGDDYKTAIEHFTRAAKMDAMFADAWIGLGRTLIATQSFAAAVPPLEHAEKLQPNNPATHFFLSVAYRRLGRREDSDREAKAREQTSEAAIRAKENVAKGILGGQQVDAKDNPAQP